MYSVSNPAQLTMSKLTIDNCASYCVHKKTFRYGQSIDHVYQPLETNPTARAVARRQATTPTASTAAPPILLLKTGQSKFRDFVIRLTPLSSTIHNQDDCLAINKGSNIVFQRNTCIGGHGISIVRACPIPAAIATKHSQLQHKTGIRSERFHCLRYHHYGQHYHQQVRLLIIFLLVIVFIIRVPSATKLCASRP